MGSGKPLGHPITPHTGPTPHPKSPFSPHRHIIKQGLLFSLRDLHHPRQLPWEALHHPLQV